MLKRGTMQELFDTACRGVIQQGKKSVGNLNEHFGGGCLYRGPNGLKCAVGHCLTDKEYDPRMEGKVVESVFDYLDINRPKVKELLTELQKCHDGANKRRFVQSFKEAARVVALRFKLNPAVLEEV